VSVISSYIRTWPLEQDQQKGSLYWDAGMVNASYLTDITIAFTLIDGSDKHTIYIPELGHIADDTPLFSNIWNEIAILKEKYPHLKVNISVGGWGADHFSDMADDKDLRGKFSAGVCDWLDRYDLDGVDIDWEYPVGPPNGQKIKSSPEDAKNYIALLQDLRDATETLGKRTGKYYSLSTAVPAHDWFLFAVNVKVAAKIVDALKLMSYDYYGPWRKNTGHVSNIFNNINDPAWGGWSTSQALELYIKDGIPTEKIQMGIAFYGRAFAGVEPGPNKDGLFQHYKSIPFAQTEGFLTWPQVQEYLKPGSGFTRYWDNVAMAPYIYNGDLWITYCDEELIKNLVNYAREKQIGGFFYWEYGTDINAYLLKTLAESI
jgi:chitinase